jgi:hypothetical protein
MTPVLTPAMALMAPLRGLPTSAALGEGWLLGWWPDRPEFAEQPPPTTASTAIPASTGDAGHQRRLSGTSVSPLSDHVR